LTVTDDEIEAMVRELIEQQLENGARQMALDWLEERIDAYKAVQESGLLDEGGGPTSA
jgi:hypothetical protein